MITCVICGQQVTSKRGLAFHIKKHGIKSVDDYMEMYPEQREFIEPKDETLLTCPICGRYNMKQLGQHITGTHKMTHDEFLEKYPNQQMFIEEISDRCRRATQIGHESYLNNVAKDPEKYADSYRKRAEKRKQNNPDIGDKISNILREHGVYDRMSQWVKEMWQNEEYRKLHSEKCKKQHENGLTDKVLEKSGKKRYSVTLNEKTYSMRSTWEVQFASYLNSINIPFEYEPFAIDYEYDGSIKKYYPDFVITGTNILFEVKPKNLTNKAINIAKMNACIAKGYDFRYITEDELKNLEILNLF